MDWLQTVDEYCERLGPGIWAEPVNAMTNAAFVLAGVVMWHRARGMAGGRVLAGIEVAIGVGSFLFHTLATRWAALADVLPILCFILAYIYLAGRDFLRLGRLWSILTVLAFFPYAALTVPVFSQIPGLGSSAGYAPIPVLIAGYALALRRGETARGLLFGAALLVVSLAFRTADDLVCAALPVGTHFVWHLLNAAMLAWMIEVWRRHVMRAGLPPERRSPR